ALFAAFAACTPWACAQRSLSGASVHFAPSVHGGAAAPFSGMRVGPATGQDGHSFQRFMHLGRGEGLIPLLADWFGSESYDSGSPEASQVPYFLIPAGLSSVLGTTSVPATIDSAPVASRESLLIELRGDRYVRVNEVPESETLSSLQANAPQSSVPRKD